MRARSCTARRLPWHTWSTSSSISGSMLGGGGKIAPRASPGALGGGASVATLDGSDDDGDSAGRLPELGLLGGAWPGLLDVGSRLLGAASIERLGRGEMGRLGAGLAALGTAWMGLLGAAALLLEGALMGRLGTGWSGLLGAAVAALGTAWMGLLGAAADAVGTEAGNKEAEGSKGMLAGLGGGWLGRLVSEALGELAGDGELGAGDDPTFDADADAAADDVPGAGTSDTAARGGVLDARMDPAGGGSLMSASQASSTESGGTSSAARALAIAPGGELGRTAAGNVRGVGASVVAPGSPSEPEPDRGADAGALASATAATPISVELSAPAVAIAGSRAAAKPCAVDAENAGALDASTGGGGASEASGDEAAPKPRMVELGGAEARPTAAAVLAAVNSSRDNSSRAPASRAPRADGAVVGAGGGRDARSPDIDGSTRRGVFGPTLARVCSGGGVLAERGGNPAGAGGGCESRRAGDSADEMLDGWAARVTGGGAVVAAARRASSAAERVCGSPPRGEALLAARAAARARAFVRREPPFAAAATAGDSALATARTAASR
jgi:hypothetical protein